jgi:hypothetical protein
MCLNKIQKDCNTILKYAKKNNNFFIEDSIILKLLDNNKSRLDDCIYQLRKDNYLDKGKGYFHINKEGELFAKKGGYKTKIWLYLTLEPYKEELGKQVVKRVVGFVLAVVVTLILWVLKIIQLPFQ